MLKPFMRLFGLDNEDPPLEARREGGENRHIHAAPGPHLPEASTLIGTPSEKSETETELERAANAQH